MELNDKVKEIIEKTILLYSYKTKRNGRTQYLFTVDLNSPCKIGGLNEDGFCLNFFPENDKSYMVIKTIELLKVLHGDIIKSGSETIQNCKR